MGDVVASASYSGCSLFGMQCGARIGTEAQGCYFHSLTPRLKSAHLISSTAHHIFSKSAASS